jgi:hypothetical protein
MWERGSEVLGAVNVPPAGAVRRSAALPRFHAIEPGGLKHQRGRRKRVAAKRCKWQHAPAPRWLRGVVTEFAREAIDRTRGPRAPRQIAGPHRPEQPKRCERYGALHAEPRERLSPRARLMARVTGPTAPPRAEALLGAVTAPSAPGMWTDALACRTATRQRAPQPRSPNIGRTAPAHGLPTWRR